MQLKALGFTPEGACPDGSRWEALVSGLIGQQEADTMLEHAGQCGRCGPLLRTLMEAMTEADQDDEKIMATLSSHTVSGQARLARRLARESRPVPAPRPPNRWWLAAAAVLLVLAAVSFWRWQGGGPPPDLLLAQAYAQGRPFDYRLRGAGHGPIRQERSSAGAGLGAKPLVDARAAITQELSRGEPSAELLRQRGEAELLALELEPAERTLRQAHAKGPSDERVAEALAIAIALRAQRSGDQPGLDEALQLLRGIATPTARFNRALVLEQSGRREEARAMWDEVLMQEPDPAWRREAEQRRERR